MSNHPSVSCCGLAPSSCDAVPMRARASYPATVVAFAGRACERRSGAHVLFLRCRLFVTLRPATSTTYTVLTQPWG